MYINVFSYFFRVIKKSLKGTNKRQQSDESIRSSHVYHVCKHHKSNYGIARISGIGGLRN